MLHLTEMYELLKL